MPNDDEVAVRKIEGGRLAEFQLNGKTVLVASAAGGDASICIVDSEQLALAEKQYPLTSMENVRKTIDCLETLYIRRGIDYESVAFKTDGGHAQFTTFDSYHKYGKLNPEIADMVVAGQQAVAEALKGKTIVLDQISNLVGLQHLSASALENKDLSPDEQRDIKNTAAILAKNSKAAVRF